MKKNHFYFLLFFLAFNLLFSQRQLAWSDTVNSAGNFSEYFGGTDGNMIELDAHKNVYSAIMSDSLGLKRVLISKHDSMGNDLWTTIFHSSPGANDWLSAIA